MCIQLSLHLLPVCHWVWLVLTLLISMSGSLDVMEMPCIHKAHSIDLPLMQKLLIISLHLKKFDNNCMFYDMMWVTCGSSWKLPLFALSVSTGLKWYIIHVQKYLDNCIQKLEPYWPSGVVIFISHSILSTWHSECVRWLPSWDTGLQVAIIPASLQLGIPIGGVFSHSRLKCQVQGGAVLIEYPMTDMCLLLWT